MVPMYLAQTSVCDCYPGAQTKVCATTDSASASDSQQLAQGSTASSSSRSRSPLDQSHQASSANDQPLRQTSRLPAAGESHWHSIDPSVAAFAFDRFPVAAAVARASPQAASCHNLPWRVRCSQASARIQHPPDALRTLLSLPERRATPPAIEPTAVPPATVVPDRP